MNLTRWLAKKCGYELIKTKKQPTLESHLLSILKHHAIDTVVDVGANIGQFAQTIRRLGFTGTIYSFEPVAETFQLLAKHAQHDAHWHVFNVALGDTNTEQTIHTSQSSDLNSLLIANAFGMEKFSNLKKTATQDIQIRRFDHFVSAHALSLGKKVMLKRTHKAMTCMYLEAWGIR